VIEEQPDSLVFGLPNRADLFSIALLPLAVCGFLGLMGLWLPTHGGSYIATLVVYTSTPPLLLFIFALVTYTLFGAAGLYWLYNMFRINFEQEVLTVTKDRLTLELNILRFSRCKTYPQPEVWQLRVIEKDRRERYFPRQSYDLDKGSYTLAFDHNAGTALFGAGISEKGAAEILEIICDKFPAYKPRDPASRHQWTPPRAV
jgi:hypothetical protein